MHIIMLLTTIQHFCEVNRLHCVNTSLILVMVEISVELKYGTIIICFQQNWYFNFKYPLSSYHNTSNKTDKEMKLMLQSKFYLE